MAIFSNRVFKYVISVLAALNIIAMMLFEYGLPSPQAMTNEYDIAKQAEEAEIALAREDTQEQEGTESEEDERDPDAPILELVTDHIFLHVGDRFNYMSYIKTMEDVDGSDLSHYIHLDKDVDTSVPGEVELTYRITSIITGKSDSKVLLITILE